MVSVYPIDTKISKTIQTLTTCRNPGFDRLIHEKTRLAIMSSLAVVKRVSFSQLKQLLGTTDGNLSVHARKLENAGYLSATKYFDGRVPKTTYNITVSGREALKVYLRCMDNLIRLMEEGAQ